MFLAACRNVDEDSLDYEEVQYTSVVRPVEDPSYDSSFKDNRQRARAFIAHMTTSAAPASALPGCMQKNGV